MKRTICVAPVILAMVSLVAVGCGEGNPTSTRDINNPPGSGDAVFRILLTDAPADYIDSAVITVTRVYLVVGDEDDEAESDTTDVEGDGADPDTSDVDDDTFVDLWPEDAEPQTFDLMTLRDGVTALLAETPVPEADYHQLRLIVEDAEVTLKEGYEFRDGSTTATLKTPSAHASGIKVQLAEPLPAEPGMVTIVVVDFDVDDNFKLQGNPDTPAGINGILFTPVLKEKSRDMKPDDD